MSETRSADIYVIGAGISGLVAALELEKAGVKPVLLEKSDRIGGRLRTDIREGLPLDHGFQVLLTAYPAARRYLDMKALALRKFLPGAMVFKGGEGHALGDPLRASAFFLPTLAFPYAGLRDKYLVWRLANRLRRKELDQIFAEEETTTMEYLRAAGFSEKIITHFFRPFFAGIFLEPELHTSSRMFEFVYKMFSEGYAALPKDGIAAIPEHLRAQLDQTEIRLGQEVDKVVSGSVIMTDGTQLPCDAVIIATDPRELVKGKASRQITWKSCDNLYFSTPAKGFRKPIIGLVADPDALVNNLHFVTDLIPAPRPGEQLLSVTIVKAHDFPEAVLIERVQEELANHCGITQVRFLRRISIPRALPDLTHISYAPEQLELNFGEGIFLAGDHLANGSLNAAMESGQAAAAAVLESLSEASN